MLTPEEIAQQVSNMTKEVSTPQPTLPQQVTPVQKPTPTAAPIPMAEGLR
jgi:hypothetical protein